MQGDPEARERIAEASFQYQKASEYQQNGDSVEALKVLGTALDLNPQLARQGRVIELAARITNLPAANVLERLLDAGQRDAFILDFEKQLQKPPPTGSRFDARIGRILAGLVVIVIIALMAGSQFAPPPPNQLKIGRGQSEIHTLKENPDQSYYVVTPYGIQPDGGWPTLVAVHGVGQTGADMVNLLSESTSANGILLVAPTFTDIQSFDSETDFNQMRDTVAQMLEEMPRIESRLGLVYAGYAEGARLVSWLARGGLDYANGDFNLKLPLGIAFINSTEELFDAPDRNAVLPYVITAIKGKPSEGVSRDYAAGLIQRGFDVDLAYVADGVAAPIDRVMAMVRRVYGQTGGQFDGGRRRTPTPQVPQV